MDIKSIIKSKGMTIKQVADLMKKKDGSPISQPALSQMISGNPSISTLREIAKAIGCNITDFFADETNPNILSCPHCGSPLVCKNCGHTIRFEDGDISEMLPQQGDEAKSPFGDC